MSRRGIAIVLAGPSGVGKTAIAERLLASDPGMQKSISATTRAPRPGEVHGTDYLFMDQAEFDDLVASGGMLEHASVFGKSYGIPRGPVVAALEQGKDVLFVIDWQGHRTLRRELPGDVLGVFVMPPCVGDLEARLRARGDTDDQVGARMAQAEGELRHAFEFKHRVWNRSRGLKQAAADVQTIIRENREVRSCA